MLQFFDVVMFIDVHYSFRSNICLHEFEERWKLIDGSTNAILKKKYGELWEHFRFPLYERYALSSQCVCPIPQDLTGDLESRMEEEESEGMVT